MQEFTISQEEIDRRIKAFSNLGICLFLGLVLSSLIFWLWNYFTILLFLLVFIIFLFSRILLGNFFKKLSQKRITLYDDNLEIIIQKSHEKIDLDTIKELIIVKTTRNKIREIRIISKNETIVLDGLANFHRFEEELIKKCNQDIKTRVINEPIDYDHPLFYILLGLMIGFLSLLFIKLTNNLDDAKLQLVLILIITFVFLMSGYFIIGKPLYKRYGGKSAIIDIIIGLIFLVCNLVLIYFIWR